MPGERHASRVAASSSSLFHSVTHMQVPTLEAYVHQAIALGRKRHVTKVMKETIAEQRMDTPLFDTQRWVRDWERGASLLWEKFTETDSINSHIILSA
eukprot:CAMPEP_0184296894 /NCGR_PEP_ID=MMETSP1049-20130417/7842_1 /TAXON_ID=77928 /ORGANISM="Proteomonas sulcata, Strain CCMP704" /LENGTH=97 /DNA_ID=CAMNT_0026606351 /DNA_START=129 /DNA_END=422 /DNA_ORIENTATION=+